MGVRLTALGTLLSGQAPRQRNAPESEFVIKPISLAPTDVRLMIGETYINAVVMPDQILPHRYVAYGPTSLGEFDEAPIISATLVEGTTLDLALLRSATGKFRFAPIPAVTERAHSAVI